MADPSVADRLERLSKALKTAIALADDSQRPWENKCESVFSEFRVSCVHLRREPQALDTIENKESAWKFINKFCKCRPFLHDRCTEVLKILMLSDSWMQAFMQSGEDVADLPKNIQNGFEKRLHEVDPDFLPNGERDEPAPEGLMGDEAASTPLSRPANMAVVVQHCQSAKILVDPTSMTFGEIGAGLVVHISFSKGAKRESMLNAARFLLNTRLSQAEDGASSNQDGASSKLDSVISLCRSGHDQGLVVVPEFSLCSQLNKDNTDIEYNNGCSKDVAVALYEVFVNNLRIFGESHTADCPKAGKLTVVAGIFVGDQMLEISSKKPSMHVFSF